MMKQNSKRWALLSGLVAACLFLGVALASGEQLPRQVIDSGGGQISGGEVRLHSVIGQPVAGPVSSGGLGLCSGFLCGSTGGAAPGAYGVYLPLVVKD
jgi:hypothetical protein